MKKKIIASLILATLSASAFALPQQRVQPLLFESKASSTIAERTVAEGGAERTGVNRVAEGGAERTGVNRVAEGGAERTGANRVAEGGAERLQERFRLVGVGAERTIS